MPLKVLIIGAGICGPAVATLLRRSDPKNSVTIVERYSEIRRNGLQIDLRAWGVPIMKHLGLIDVVRKRCVEEDGIAFLDAKGKQFGVFGVQKSGTGQQSFTSEFEIMRGDLAEVLYDASLKNLETEPRAEGGPGVRYKFGTSVASLTQDEKGVDVTLSDGTTGRYDLVIGADGQWSKTRRIMFGDEAGNDMFKRLNLYAAYWTIPRQAGDDGLARFFAAGKGRNVMSRTGDLPYTQVYFMIRTPSEEVRQSVEKQSTETQKEVFERLFRDIEYCHMDRFLKGLRESTDFYAHSLGQVKAPHVVKGRIALLGDAAACASPVSGMGTTLSLITAWMLAGELARHKGDVPLALQAYDANVRPYVEELQKLLPGIPAVMTPQSGWAIVLLRFFISIASWIKLDLLLGKVMSENKGGFQIPEYPELNLGSAVKSS
ncbi:FAD/NAD(P)-binding domain-containing protein [Hypoxylon crocopeplum]|nr:FAD/NAD(P)-binding domain-containing protein [Hypoxylon crocopeplum]